MKFSRLSFPLFVCSLLTATALAAEDGAPKKPAEGEKKDPPAAKNMHKKHGPGLLNDLWAKLKPGKKAEPGTAAALVSDAVERPIGNKKLWLSMSVEPHPLKLSETRQLKVVMHVANKSSKLVQLDFPTTQRIEVLVHHSSGKLVEQWSEDRNFANEPGMVSINPGERLEYTVTLSTRDFVAGQQYTVETLFPNHESLRLQKTVVPVP